MSENRDHWQAPFVRPLSGLGAEVKTWTVNEERGPQVNVGHGEYTAEQARQLGLNIIRAADAADEVKRQLEAESEDESRTRSVNSLDRVKLLDAVWAAAEHGRRTWLTTDSGERRAMIVPVRDGKELEGEAGE